MAHYASGMVVNHIFKVRINGTAASTGDVTGLSGRVFIDGTYSASVPVTITSLGSGEWHARYTVPANVSNGADLTCVVDMTVSGVGQSVVFVDQVYETTVPSTIRSYLVANPYDVNLTDAQVSELVVQIATGGVSAEEIAKQVLLVGASDALAEGTMDRHSLGSLVLIATNADTTSNPGAITVRHPDTDAALFQYVITTGAGCPIQSVT